MITFFLFTFQPKEVVVCNFPEQPIVTVDLAEKNEINKVERNIILFNLNICQMIRMPASPVLHA